MKKERLQTLLRNALIWIDEENHDFFSSEVGNEYEWYENTLGITKKELQELDITCIKDGSEEKE